MRIVLSSMLLLTLVLSGCASAAGSGRGGGNFNLITSELLREADAEGLHVYQIIERNRPSVVEGRPGCPHVRFCGGRRGLRPSRA